MSMSYAASLAALFFCAAFTRAGEESIEVKVVTVLASSGHTNIDPRLKELAASLKKKYSHLTGFEVFHQSKESVRIGESSKFPLVEGTEIELRLKGRDEKGHVAIVVKAPTLGKFTYSCCCTKYFPVVTRYTTKDDKVLVIAIMVQPCQKKKPNPPPTD